MWIFTDSVWICADSVWILYSFCAENCGATGCKLLILLEGVAAAQFLCAF